VSPFSSNGIAIDFSLSKSHKCPISFVNEVTTLRRHQESAHRVSFSLSFNVIFIQLYLEGDYLKWAKNNNFVSMLPKDAKRRREEAATDQQSSINSHLKPRVPNERVIQYTDALFREAATQWLIDTDQVCLF
jgi:hypothetical protein